MGKLHVMDHPLIQHKVSLMRDINTGTKEFRELLEEVAMLMAYEVTRDLPTREVPVETPFGRAVTKVVADRPVTLVPLLRSGLVMADGVAKLVPAARTGHIGIFREREDNRTVKYFCKLPEGVEDSLVLVFDAMLGTGMTAIKAVWMLKEAGCQNIRFVCLVASREGVDELMKVHPDVDVYAAGYDLETDEKGFVLPGLGDAGDRLFGTR